MTPKPMRGVKPKGPLAQFPYLASPKIDGLRAWVKDGVVLSKTGKPIPSQVVQQLFGHLHGLDGELTVGPAHKQHPEDDVFDRSRGPIMRRDAEADFRFWVFDRWDLPNTTADRRTYKPLGDVEHVAVREVQHKLVLNQAELDYYVEKVLERGFEGVMLRHLKAPYKWGTSTEKEGYLLKIKPMTENNALILGYEEQMENTNAASKDEFGYTKRSSAKAGKVGKGTLGAFLVRDVATGSEFSVGNGPGLTHAMRDQLWAERDTLIGKYITYRYQAIGTKDAPRLPQFIHFRDAMDISETVE